MFVRTLLVVSNIFAMICQVYAGGTISPAKKPYFAGPDVIGESGGIVMFSIDGSKVAVQGKDTIQILESDTLKQIGSSFDATQIGAYSYVLLNADGTTTAMQLVFTS